MARLALLGLLALVAALLSPSPPYDSFPVVFRGQLEAEENSGHLLPVVMGERRIGLCLAVSPTVDSHGWIGVLRVGRQVLAEALEASPRRTGTVCFETMLAEGGVPDGEHSLCLEIVDRVDGNRIRPLCRRFRYRREWQGSWEIWDRVREAIGGEDPLANLDRLKEEARNFGMRLMPIQIELITVHQLVQRGDGESLDRALERLRSLPAWLEDEIAGHWAGMAASQQARLLELRGRREDAWRALADAEAALRPSASSHWLGVVMHQAGLLAEQGAIGRAVERLRFALDECELSPCRDGLVAHARGQLAWRLLQQTDVTVADLDQAESMLEAVAMEVGRDPLETANQRINLAWVRQRRAALGAPGAMAPSEEEHPGEAGRDVPGALAGAREILTQEEESERSRVLAGWADLVEALAWLESGAVAEASRRCESLVTSHRRPQPGAVAQHVDAELAAAASACAGRGARLRGDLPRAAELFEVAILHHEYLRLGEGRAHPPMGTSERAELFYRAARVAAERGDVAGAWAVLDRLDSLASGLVARQRCRSEAAGRDVESWQRLDAESASLFERLRQLEKPVAGAARAIRQSQRRDAKQRLRAILESRPGCDRPQAAGSVADLRLFVIDDQLWRLERGGAARRVELGDLPLSAIARELRQARADRTLEDLAWRRLAAPLVEPLLAAIDSGPVSAVEAGQVRRSGRVRRVALHGVLQDIPWMALPLDSGPEDFSNRHFTLARVPIASVPVSSLWLDGMPRGGPHGGPDVGQGTARSGMIVLDPLGDLAAARSMLPFFRDLTPGAKILAGGEATLSAFSGAATADWLHVDGHGRYDEAFPELSGLRMADGLLDMPRLASLEKVPGFVNLSGCRTGAWPRTADSGHYGLGGLLVRAGASWVITSADDLDNDLASDFNRAFYQALFEESPEGGVHEGRTGDVPRAFRRALAQVAQRYPASSWSNLQLLASPVISPREGGNPSPPLLRIERSP